VSDIDTGVADSLKVLDPKRPIREADICIAANLLFITPQLCLRAGQAVCGASPDRKRHRAPFGSTQGRKQ